MNISAIYNSFAGHGVYIPGKPKSLRKLHQLPCVQFSETHHQSSLRPYAWLMRRKRRSLIFVLLIGRSV